MSLNMLEQFLFVQSLHHPSLFKRFIRPELYRRYGNNAEAVHDAVLTLLSNDAAVLGILEGNRRLFEAGGEQKITVNERRIAPYGSAAGMDKNGDALLPFSYTFGFQEPGTVILNERPGNNRVRVATDEKSEDAWNAQGFPSRGLNYFLHNVRNFRSLRGGVPTVYASICGLPLSEENAIEVAMEEMERLMSALNPYVDGFVWNPFSPNTSALALLRTPKIFRENAELMKRYAQNKLRLVKIGPYHGGEEEQNLPLINGFMEGGGHGVVAVNTRMFPKEQIPVPNWGYPSGGRSGRFLQNYRMKAVRDMRNAFPDSVIVATGGIYDGDDAYETFKAGVTALEGYTPYMFYGIGLLGQIERRVAQRLNQDGYRNMEQLQEKARRGSKLIV